MAFEPRNLTELLEWRSSLPGWQRRSSWDYLEELRRLCAPGRIEVVGRPVLDGFGIEVGEPQSVPAEAFADYRLSQEFATNHGCLCERLAAMVWTDLRFLGSPCRVWQAALEAGEIMAPRASSPLPEAAQPIPTVPVEAPAPVFAELPDKPGPKPGGGKPLKALAAPIAAGILQAPDRPPHKHGWRAEVARRVQQALKARDRDYELSSISRELRGLVHPDPKPDTESG